MQLRSPSSSEAKPEAGLKGCGAHWGQETVSLIGKEHTIRRTIGQNNGRGMVWVCSHARNVLACHAVVWASRQHHAPGFKHARQHHAPGSMHARKHHAPGWLHALAGTLLWDPSFAPP
eukprot:scaffold15132_cov21-Tisochrysis_lutea.AAC.1